jgi:hypothetical protein
VETQKLENLLEPAPLRTLPTDELEWWKNSFIKLHIHIREIRAGSGCKAAKTEESLSTD